MSSRSVGGGGAFGAPFAPKVTAPPAEQPPKLSTGQPPTTAKNWPKSRKTPIFQKISDAKPTHTLKMLNKARPRPSPSPGVPHWTPHQCNPPGSVERLRRDKGKTNQAHRDAKKAEEEHGTRKHTKLKGTKRRGGQDPAHTPKPQNGTPTGYGKA